MTTVYEVRSPYDGRVVGQAPDSSEAEVRAALDRAEAVRPALAQMPAHRRAALLTKTAGLLEAHSDDIARLIAAESGKPLRYARAEAMRAVETFTFAAEEAKRMHGETLPMDAAKGGLNKIGYYVRVPVGIVAAVTPFNFPLNLVAHKVAPALAAGCPIVLKPAPATPLTAFKLRDLMHEAGVSEGMFEVVNGGAEVGRWLTTDPRVAMITFTGSPSVARVISRDAGLRRTTFELGGNAAVILDETVDALALVDKIAIGAFAHAGQVCISIQRVYVHQSQYDAFVSALSERAAGLVAGDPSEERTELGPVINDAAAERIEAWVSEAIAAGANLAVGGTRDGRMMAATVLTDVTPEMKVMREEVFGPVVCVIPFKAFDDALAMADDSPFGLQAGVFTRDLGRAMQAVQRLNVGGVIINDTPTFRVDHMPYGGNKDSGVGREGPRFAIEDMTTLKMVVIHV
ncbi:MAG: aldehyde dehydrogenase family protein [Anaerolineae bacterium]|nr:aldehyde dehydrogenase family protein [Anaerolineae bacterium]